MGVVSELVLLLALLFFERLIVRFGQCQEPPVVRIGAVFTYDSVIGRVAKTAMKAAVDDVNADPSILNGTKLEIVSKDVNCNAFMGAIGAFQVLEKEPVAIIGPQSSAVAHMISTIANAFHVPLVSYAATDPTLSALQFPFFLRTTPSDSYQMSAIADLIEFYGWRDVIAIYVDNDYGRNGIYCLGDELNKRTIRLPHTITLPEEFDANTVAVLLNESKTLGPSVYVVHVNPDPEFRIFDAAELLGMMSSNYVWFATEWFTATLDSLPSVNRSIYSTTLQGVVSLRQHMPASSKMIRFSSQWKIMQQKGLAISGLNVYGFLAYDTVWAVARSIDELINESKTAIFSFSNQLGSMNAKNLHLYNLKIFDGGRFLRKKILRTNFSGVSGQVEFRPDKSRLSRGYEVINVHDGVKIDVVGYWSTPSGLSLSSPENLKRQQRSRSRLNQKLRKVTWPGGETEKPRGWVIANNGEPLRIGVPRRVSFTEFVTVYGNSSKVEGYCIDVFNEARKLVPYDVPYRLQLFGDGHSNPNYNELVKKVADGKIDAAIGDIAIVTKRTKIVDFTQPYAATGLVIVAPVDDEKATSWVFLKPFTLEMWCATASSFVLIGVVIWILEHRVNDDFRGPPRRQIVTILMFTFSTLFKKNQAGACLSAASSLFDSFKFVNLSEERTVSSLGRLVMVVWLFLLMVISASYTASLTSILTVEKLSSPITGIDSLLTSNWPIGYQVGSFAYNYLKDELNIHRSRLIALGNPEAYERALRKGPTNGGVAAIIDELPYVEIFLSNRTGFAIVGQTFTKGGWGFAFKRESPLAVDMSTAILKLSESGELQKIHEKWFCKLGCPGDRNGHSESELRFSNFMGLFVLCGAISLAALLMFLLRVVWLFLRYRQKQNETELASLEPPRTRLSKLAYSFLEFIDKKEEAIKNLFAKNDNPQPELR